MYAWETGPVDDLALLLLCGEPDFKVRHFGETALSDMLAGRT